MPVAPPDRIVAHVYDKDCKTRLGWLPRASQCGWVEVNSQRGTGSFQVPLTDASTALLELNRVVKLTWLHKGRHNLEFWIRLKTEAAQLAVDGIRWLRFENQPGIFDFLGDATVDPDTWWMDPSGNPDPDSPDTRHMGFMSPAGQVEWYHPSAWIKPRTEPWGKTGGEHKNFPTDFGSFDQDAEWISVVDPSATQPPYVRNYFRASLTLTAATDVRIVWTADNYPDLFIDGDLAASWGPPGSHQWKTAQTTDMRLDAGDHLIAVGVKNSRHVIPSKPNPIALIMSVREVLPSGKLGSVLLRTNATDWLVHDNSPQPGWHAAEALRRHVVEAQNRSVTSLLPLKFGYHLKRDSHGRRWHDRDQYSFDRNGPSLAEIATQLAEGEGDRNTGMDVWMTARGGPRLMAAIERGKNRSATVALYLGDHVNGDGNPDGTLKAHEVTATMPVYTFGKVKLANGRWITVHNDANVDQWGRIEATMSVDTHNSDDTDRQVARSILSQNDDMRVEAQTDDSQLEGAVAGRDYGMGDTITVPGRRGVTMKARVLALHVQQTEWGVSAWPEYREDVTA